MQVRGIRDFRLGAINGRAELLVGLVIWVLSLIGFDTATFGNMLSLAVFYSVLVLLKYAPPLAVVPLAIAAGLWAAGIADYFLLSGFLIYLAVEFAVARRRPAIAAILVAEFLVLAYYLTIDGFPRDLLMAIAVESLCFGTAVVVGRIRLRMLGERRHLQHAQQELQRSLQTNIAHYLHDSLARSLTVMAMQAELARLEVGDPEIRRKLDAISDSGRTALDDLRQLVDHLVQDQSGDADGALGAWNTSTVGASVRTAVELLEAAGYRISCREVDPLRRLRREVEIAFALAFNEVTSNLVKHAPTGAKVRILVREEDEWLTVTVRNARAPAAAKAVPGNGGLGMGSITARMRTVGGDADFQVTPDSWSVTLTMPADTR